MILTGDIGGTKTRLALFERDNSGMVRKDLASFKSKDYENLETILIEFLHDRKVQVDRACIGVPGPVKAGRSQMTNLSWKLDASKLKLASKIKNFKLVNDLVAMTAALPYLKNDDLIQLHAGTAKEKATCAVLAPGTGLGQAFLTWHNHEPVVHASEGGHADFAPTNQLEADLYKYLVGKFDRVSYERVLSGPGLVNIYNFLKDSGYAPEPPELPAKFKRNDPSAVIAEYGQAKKSALCEKAIDIFAALLGALAGNLVLTLLATGGVYLGGGIPPKLADKLSDGSTTEAFLNKGRLSDIVKEAPLYIIKDDHAALLGAAYLAVA